MLRIVETKFNDWYSDYANNYANALVEAEVDVYNVMDEATPIARLHKDDVLLAVDGVYTREKMESYDFLRWTEGLYCFDDTPLSEVFDKLQKYYNTRILVETPSLLDYRCTGKFKERDGIDHILRVLQKDHKFTFKNDIEKNTITIK